MARIAVAGLCAVHLAVAIWHGNAHTELGVELSAAQTLFVYGVIVLGPLVAAVLCWTRYALLGFSLFVATMTAALLFGAYYHFVFLSPDNVYHLPAGTVAAHIRFTLSAMILALVELAAAIAGAYLLGWQSARSANAR